MTAFKLKLPIVEIEFSCLNCDGILIATEKPKLFCSDKCQQEAGFVRYFRSCRRDGRINQPDIREALEIKMAHILGGGYKISERRLSLSTREKIYERDNRTCQKCGQPATDIDHIHDSSDNLENLQMLCRDCHNQKTTANFVKLKPEVEGYEKKLAEIDSLRIRTESEIPKRICDDEEKWKSLWRGFMSERRSVLKIERLLRHARNEGDNVPNSQLTTND